MITYTRKKKSVMARWMGGEFADFTRSYRIYANRESYRGPEGWVDNANFQYSGDESRGVVVRFYNGYDLRGEYHVSTPRAREIATKLRRRHGWLTVDEFRAANHGRVCTEAFAS